MKRLLLSMACVGVLACGLIPAMASAVTAQDKTEKKKPSDRTVRVIMGWAFAAVPETRKDKDGKEVKLDRSDPKKYMIPLEDARRVIRVATRSAGANLCGLKDLEAQNFRKMMSREKALNKWSSEQILFIKHLHIAAGLVITGKFVAGKEAAGKTDNSSFEKREYNCSADEREKVKVGIEAYLKE